MKIRERFSSRFKDLKIFFVCAAVIPSLAFGQSEGPSAVRSIYLGIDGSIVSSRLNGFPAEWQLTTPEQSLRISTSLGNSLRVEVPLRVVISKSREFGWRTGVRSGLLLDAFPSRLIRRSSSIEQTGFFLGGGPLVDYDHYGDTQRQYGVVGRAGVELGFNTVHMRVAALSERWFGEEHAISKKRSGVSVGLSYPMVGDHAARDGVWDTGWYVQTRLGVNRTIIHDYDTQDAFNLPKVFFGVFHFIGSQRVAALGVRGNIDYSGNDQQSQSYIRVQPRAEINLLSRSGARRGIQLGAHATLEHSGSGLSAGDSFGRSYYGGGGDVSITLPAMPTMWKFGVGFDRMGAKGLRPAITDFRFDVALDRFLFGDPKPPKKMKKLRGN